MRVGIDYRSALINREGIGRATRELVRALVEEGHADELGLFGWTLASSRVPRTELGLGTARLARWRFPSRWLPKLFEFTRRGADDFVGGCAVFHHAQPSRLAVRGAVEVATIYDCIYAEQNDFLSPEAARRMLDVARELVAHVALVIVPSEYVGREVVRVLGARPERVRSVWLGCDHVLRSASELGAVPRDSYLLTIARVDARKNHVRMLAAFERLVREGLPQRWIIAGPAGHGSELFAQALAASPARERVEWRPFVSEAELRALCDHCSLFAFPSLAEGFGLPPLEAMVLGAPTLVGACSSLPELVGDGALQVDPTDIDAIFEGARTLLLDRERALDLARRGRERAQTITWRRCAQATWSVYSEAAR